MSKIGDIVDKMTSKLSWKFVAYIFIGMFLFKSCQSCNRSNKIERIEKNRIEVVDSLTKRIDSLNVANDKLATVIDGKNEVNSVQIENVEFYQYKIKNLTDSVKSKDNQIKQLKSTIKRKDGEISNLNIKIGKLEVEVARLNESK